jgi:hypothetical protein
VSVSCSINQLQFELTRYNLYYPSQPNGRLGVFDEYVILYFQLGLTIKSVPKGYMDFPTLIYTGVKYLPTGWTIPYTPGTETQNLASTEDDRATWHKLDLNPVMDGALERMNITA